MTRSYEFVLIVRPDTDVLDEVKQKELVTKLSGTEAQITDLTYLGKKTLAYPIKKLAEGLYILVHFTANNLTLDSLERQVKLNDAVLRYMIVVK